MAGRDSIQLPQVKALFSDVNVFNILETIANTKAPSQTVRFTRAPVIEDIVRSFQGNNLRFDSDYKRTGNSLLWNGKEEPQILFIAHADQISYLVESEVDHNLWRLLPFCKHLSEIEVPAVSLRYSLEDNCLIKRASGNLFSRMEGERLTPYFSLQNGDLQTGDRIVYETPLVCKEGIAHGNIDNAAGVTACLIAALALNEAFPFSGIGFVFTDEEEGPAENPLYFARGARRLFRKIRTPEFCGVVDGHGGHTAGLGKGAFYTEKTGKGVATVTPPDLYAKIKNLAEEIRSERVLIFEDLGPVSRGDDIACLEVTSQVLSIGYPSENRHFDHALPSVSISDLLHLAKAIFWIGAYLNQIR